MHSIVDDATTKQAQFNCNRTFNEPLDDRVGSIAQTASEMWEEGTVQQQQQHRRQQRKQQPRRRRQRLVGVKPDAIGPVGHSSDWRLTGVR